MFWAGGFAISIITWLAGMGAVAHDRWAVGADLACMRAQLGDSEFGVENAGAVANRHHFEVSAVEAAAEQCHFTFKVDPKSVEVFFLREKSGEVRKIGSVSDRTVAASTSSARALLSSSLEDYENWYVAKSLIFLIPIASMIALHTASRVRRRRDPSEMHPESESSPDSAL